MNVRKGLMALAAGAAVLLGGCSVTSAPIAATVTCEQATHDLANAQSRFDAAKALVADVGTPAEKEKTDKVNSASAEVDRLTAMKKEACNPTTTPTATPTPTVTVTASAAPVNAQDLVNQLTGPGKPFELVKEKINVGGNVVTDAPVERGNAVFSAKSLKTQADIREFLNGTSEQSKAARERVTTAITESVRKDNPSFTDEQVKAEVARALDGSGYFPVQVTVASEILGTTYFKDGKVLTADGWRSVGPNDIFWMFLTQDQKIVLGATLRADCGNPELTTVRPVTPGNPNPPVECPQANKPEGPGEYTWNPVTFKFKKVDQSWTTQQNNNPAGSGQAAQTNRGNQQKAQQQSKGVPSSAPSPQPTASPTNNGGTSTESGTNSGSNTGGTAEEGDPGDAGGGNNDGEISCPFGGC